MIPNRLMKAVAIAGAASVVFAACGSDDDAATDTTPTETVESDTATSEPVNTDGESSATSDPVESMSEVAVTTYFGEETTVPYQPETVVVLDYAALDILDALDVGDAVVAIPAGTPPPPHLEAYSSTENVGNLFEVDFEAINALAPDLIIAGGRSQELVPDLAAIAPTIDMTNEWGSQPYLDSVHQNVTAIGEIFGVEDEAAAALEEIDEKIADVAEQAADEGTGLVVLTTGGELSAYGPDPAGRFDFVYNLLGITPAAEQVAIDTHGDAISFEFLAETNPDMLFVLDRDAAIGAEGASAQEILDNPLVASTSAAQNDKIVYVDGAKWYLSVGGLQSLNTIIDEVDAVVD